MVREPTSHKPCGPAIKKNIYIYIYCLQNSLFSQCNIYWTVTNCHLFYTLFIRMLLLHVYHSNVLPDGWLFAQLLSPVWLFVITWIVAHQAFLSMGVFSGKNSALHCDFLLQRIFPTQGLYAPVPCLLHWQAVSLPLSHLSSPVCSLPFKYV